MKIVNQHRNTYFLLGIFCVVVLVGMLTATLLLPKTLVAPDVSTYVPRHDTAKSKNETEEKIYDASSDAEAPVTRLLFTGDIMLARAVEAAIKEHGAAYPFALWQGAAGNFDAVIGNFEGTVREKENIEATNIMAFDTLPAYISALHNAGFTHLSLANNHADDFGEIVTHATRTTILEHDMIPFGDPFTSEDFVTHIAGETPVALIGFHAFGEETSDIFEIIAAEHEADNVVIVYPHWGNEYIHEPSSAQRQAADAWIAAGADIIIGAHPHVVQTLEMRNGTPVIASLGNFLFDQDFSLETQIGATVEITISKDNITLVFTPIRITHRQMVVDHDFDDELQTWLGVDALEFTIDR